MADSVQITAVNIDYALLQAKMVLTRALFPYASVQRWKEKQVRVSQHLHIHSGRIRSSSWESSDANCMMLIMFCHQYCTINILNICCLSTCCWTAVSSMNSKYWILDTENILECLDFIIKGSVSDIKVKLILKPIFWQIEVLLCCGAAPPLQGFIT